MKPLRHKIQERSTTTPQYVIEKDYAISYILAGIAKQPALYPSLIFKGGTALKKIFFGNYRFSEDLDFSTINAPKEEKLVTALNEAIANAKEMLLEQGPFELKLERKPERAPHPNGQEAFIIGVKFPWQNNFECRIKVEITHDEPVILKPECKSIIHQYEEEKLEPKIYCYVMEEIIAEKLRTLLQTHKKLITRGWNRPRARDYYDLWYILKNYPEQLNKILLIDTLNKKCLFREVSYKKTDDFFTSELIKEAELHWKETLEYFVKGLPAWPQVLEEVRISVESLF